VSRVLIVEPDRALRETLALCVRDAGWQADAVGDAGDARAFEAGRHTAVVIDVGSAPALAWIEALRRRSPDTAVIAMGTGESRDLGIAALERGVREFLRKPFQLRALERALATALPAGRRAVRGAAPSASDPRMQRLLHEIEVAARTDATLALIGERGTGRRRLARFVHAASARSEAPFVSLGGDAESGGDRREAVHTALDAARGGTLLIDEPAELAAAAQAALLDALSRHTSVTDRDEGRMRARCVIVARRPMRDEPHLRPELRLRLDVLAFPLPPLRERPADVEYLARAFIERAALASGARPPRLSRDAIAALQALPLPGNANELAALMERAVLLFADREIDVASLLQSRPLGAAPPEIETLDLRTLERATVERALERFAGNRTHAARALGISVRTLRNKIREYRLPAATIA
jgi:two-component system response regulator FlrC